MVSSAETLPGAGLTKARILREIRKPGPPGQPSPAPSYQQASVTPTLVNSELCGRFGPHLWTTSEVGPVFQTRGDAPPHAPKRSEGGTTRRTSRRRLSMTPSKHMATHPIEYLPINLEAPQSTIDHLLSRQRLLLARKRESRGRLALDPVPRPVLFFLSRWAGPRSSLCADLLAEMNSNVRALHNLRKASARGGANASADMCA